MGKFSDLSGLSFGRLKVIKRVDAGENCYGRRLLKWECLCSCGNTTYVNTTRLKSGYTSSCGCYHKEQASKPKTHGARCSSGVTPGYYSWTGMIGRCHNKNNKRYNEWGGRGITVCERWRNSFSVFIEDMGEKPSKNHSIDRIDNDKGYYPGNCRWATPLEQGNNTRQNKHIEFEGENLTLSQWAKRFGCSRATIRMRLRRGHTMEQVRDSFA